MTLSETIEKMKELEKKDEYNYTYKYVLHYLWRYKELLSYMQKVEYEINNVRIYGRDMIDEE